MRSKDSRGNLACESNRGAQKTTRGHPYVVDQVTARNEQWSAETDRTTVNTLNNTRGALRKTEEGEKLKVKYKCEVHKTLSHLEAKINFPAPPLQMSFSLTLKCDGSDSRREGQESTRTKNGKEEEFLPLSLQLHANSLKRLFEAWIRSTGRHRIDPDCRDWESVWELGYGLIDMLLAIMITARGGKSDNDDSVR